MDGARFPGLLGNRARSETLWLPLGGCQRSESIMSRREASAAWRAQTVISAEESFRLLGIDRSTGYKAIRDGTFPAPVLRIGRVIRIPTAALSRLLDPFEHPPDPEEVVSDAG